MKEEKNKFEETASVKGFFKQYYNDFKSKIDSTSLNTFSELQNDEDRVIFVSNILPECTEVNFEINGGKDLELAKQLKEKGNAEFVRGDTTRALKSYNNSILKTPFNTNSNTEIALVLANRSAALYHLENFESAIRDIDLALRFDYPKELRYKILERKAKCLLALKQHVNALDAFKKTLQALDDSKLMLEKKLKTQKDVQIMLNLLTSQKTQQGRINALLEGDKNKLKDTQTPPSLVGKVNSQYPAMTGRAGILVGEEVGRYACALKAIAPGDVVAVEKAYCSVLLSEHSSDHCLHCFKGTMTPYPCSGCSIAVFCSEECQTSAQNSYHAYECSIINSLYKSGASVMVLMALRIISQRPLKYFLDLKTALQEPLESLKKYNSNDYLAVYHLVRHEKQRAAEDFFERTVMATFLLRCLQKVKYFGENSNNTVNEHLTQDESFIGGLILRHLQLLQFNAHEIAELETDCTESVDKYNSVFLGGGLFPTLALFNHSCDPAVVRYFVGTTVVVRTVRPIEEGDLIAENYGPIFTIKERTDRRKSLRGQYWFDCNCKACEEDWPLLSAMNRQIIRFRCDTGDGAKCSGVLSVPLSTEDFLPKCTVCGQHTNILKGLKILQDTDAMFRQASMDSNRGMTVPALNIYLEILKLLHRHLAPPFHDYHLCQQAIRKLMLSLGNKRSKEI